MDHNFHPHQQQLAMISSGYGGAMSGVNDQSAIVVTASSVGGGLTAPSTSSGTGAVVHQQQQQLPQTSQPNNKISTRPTQPIHVQRLKQLLDLDPFLQQLSNLVSSPIKIPGNWVVPPGSNGQPKHSFFSVKGIWQSEEERLTETSRLYNFCTLKKRKWLKDILLEESDSDSDGEMQMTETDLKMLLKIHRTRRKYQKKYHTDIMNSQYTYYGAGLLSEHDRYPQHQQYVCNTFGFGSVEAFSQAQKELEEKQRAAEELAKTAPPLPVPPVVPTYMDTLDSTIAQCVEKTAHMVADHGTPNSVKSRPVVHPSTFSPARPQQGYQYSHIS